MGRRRIPPLHLKMKVRGAKRKAINESALEVAPLYVRRGMHPIAAYIFAWNLCSSIPERWLFPNDPWDDYKEVVL